MRILKYKYIYIWIVKNYKKVNIKSYHLITIYTEVLRYRCLKYIIWNIITILY